jgi:hypothetical protein
MRHASLSFGRTTSMPQEKAALSIVAVVNAISQLNPARVTGTAQSNWQASPNASVRMRESATRQAPQD